MMGCFSCSSWCQVFLACLLILFTLLAIAVVHEMHAATLCSPMCLSADAQLEVHALDSAGTDGSFYIKNETALEELPIGCTEEWYEMWGSLNMSDPVELAACTDEVRVRKSLQQIAFSMMILLTLPGTILSAYAGWYGCALYQRLGHGESLVDQPFGEVGQTDPEFQRRAHDEVAE